MSSTNLKKAPQRTHEPMGEFACEAFAKRGMKKLSAEEKAAESDESGACEFFSCGSETCFSRAP